MKKLIEWTCEGDPKAVRMLQVGVDGRPARYPVDAHNVCASKWALETEPNWVVPQDVSLVPCLG